MGCAWAREHATRGTGRACGFRVGWVSFSGPKEPAKDYLLALDRPRPALFRGIAWSSARNS